MTKKNTTIQTTEDLLKVVSELREKNRQIRFGSAGSQSRNTRESRNNRRTIARALTEIRSQKVANNVKTA